MLSANKAKAISSEHANRPDTRVPNLRVVEYQPWRRPLVIAISAFLSVVCLVVGYALGENKVFAERTSSLILTEDLVEANERIVALEARLVDAELNVGVKETASNQLREDMSELHQKVERLESEVTFYKSLMAPNELTQGLQISELDITPNADVFHFELLLTQKALRRRFINGTVSLALKGVDDSGNEVVKPFTELTENSQYPLKFKFRFFQDLTGEFTLPQGLDIQEVVVIAKQNGKDPLTATFAWPEKNRLPTWW